MKQSRSLLFSKLEHERELSVKTKAAISEAQTANNWTLLASLGTKMEAITATIQTLEKEYEIVTKKVGTMSKKIQAAAKKAFQRSEMPFTKLQAMEWAVQIASGTAFLHWKGYVHRDMKPQNVLLNKSNDALVADLGTVSVSCWCCCYSTRYISLGLTLRYRHYYYCHCFSFFRCDVHLRVCTPVTTSYRRLPLAKKKNSAWKTYAKTWTKSKAG